MSKPKRNERIIKGISSLGKKQRLVFKEFLNANPHLRDRVYRLKELNMVDLVATWLDGIQYGKYGHKWKRK